MRDAIRLLRAHSRIGISGGSDTKIRRVLRKWATGCAFVKKSAKFEIPSRRKRRREKIENIWKEKYLN